MDSKAVEWLVTFVHRVLGMLMDYEVVASTPVDGRGSKCYSLRRRK